MKKALLALAALGMATSAAAATGDPFVDETATLRLDGLDLDEAQQEAVVAEVQAAFALNQALFVELAAELDLLGAR